MSETLKSEAYIRGLNDAWELAKKIYDTTHADRNKIFGLDNSCNGIKNVFEMFAPQEALAKIEAYEKEKEIKVGDEVFFVAEPTLCGVVTRIKSGIYVMWGDGSCGTISNPETIKKTGKHIDIESLLKQIGE